MLRFLGEAQFVFGYMFVMSCVGLVSMLGRLLRIKARDSDEIVFEARPAVRFSAAMIGGLMAYGTPIFWTILNHTSGTLERVCGYTMLGLTVLVTVLFFWFAGPLQLRFDLRRRTYRFGRGWVWRWTFGGPLEDLAAVHVRPSIWWDWKEADAVFAGRDNGGGITVWLEWRHPRRQRQLLVSFRFQRLSQAKAFAERIASALGVPLVEDRSPSTAGYRIW